VIGRLGRMVRTPGRPHEVGEVYEPQPIGEKSEGLRRLGLVCVWWPGNDVWYDPALLVDLTEADIPPCPRCMSRSSQAFINSTELALTEAEQSTYAPVAVTWHCRAAGCSGGSHTHLVPLEGFGGCHG
jgi:hypothetical protein